MGRAGGGELSEEVGDGVDVGKLYYGRSIALAYLCLLYTSPSPRD